MTVESRLGRVAVEAGDAVASGIRSGSGLLSSGFRDDLCRTACLLPYRPAAETVNRLSGRSLDGEEVALSLVRSACVAEGTTLSEAERDAAKAVVASWGEAFNEDGTPVATSADELPESLRQGECEVIELDPEEILDGMDAGGWRELASVELPDALSMGVEELAEVVGESEPYSGGSAGRRARRTSRSEADGAAKAAILAGYVRWLNSSDVPSRRKVLSSWEIERDSSQVCYVAIDAVVVDEQCAHRVAGGKPEARDSKTYVKHWNARVEADGATYNVTSVDEDVMYLELMACLLENGLLTRRLVFLVDGETRIGEGISRWFAPWQRSVYLDWHHLQEKIYQYMSSIVVARRVDDPDAEVEYYVRGRKKGLPKPCRSKTSLSRLYAKEACLIAWVGNAAQLVAYVRGIPSADVKNEEARRKLLGYLERKGDLITCYALRRRVGLRNSSNGAEQQNQLLVSQRQKQPLMSWRETGSAALAQLSALYRNGEDDEWYSEGSVTFCIPGLEDAA